MSGRRTVDVTVRGRNDASPAFRHAAGDAESFGARVGKLLNPLALLKGAIAGLGIAALGRFFRDSVQSASEASAAWGRVESAVTNAGLSFNLVRGDLDKLFASIQQTTRFSDDAAADAFARLVSISNDYAGSVRNLAVVTDLAAAKKMDLKTAADLVGKAMIGETAMLKRHGIVIAEGSDAIAEISRRFQGFADRDAKTMEGQLSRVANSWDDVKEAVGRAILGFDGASSSTGLLVSNLNGLATWIDTNRSGIYELAEGAKNLATWLLKITGIGAVAKVAAEGYDRLFTAIAMLAGYDQNGPEDAGSGQYYKDLGRIQARRRREQTDAIRRQQQEARRQAEQARAREEAKKAAPARQREMDQTARDLERLGDKNAWFDDDYLRGQVGQMGERPSLIPRVSDEVIRSIDTATTKITQMDVAAAAVRDTVLEMSESVIGSFAMAWSDATISIVQGSEKAGSAIGKAIRRGVGTGLVASGQSWLLEAGAIAVKGLYNPVDWWRAGRLALYGTTAIALGGAMAGGGGGGGGLSAGSMQQQQRDVQEGRGEGTIIIQGGLLDMSDPRQADALTDAINELGERRVVIKGGSR